MTESNTLSPEFKQAQRARLQEMLRQLSARSLEARQTIRDQEHEVGDSVDTSTEELDTASILQLKKNEMETMHLIEQALERMEDDVYGECEECGDEIGRRRLEIQPFSLLCVECKETIEREAKRQLTRPGLMDGYE